MQLHQLRYFVSVVNSGSITKAAERCFISQPSISQQIAKLEENVGKKLFARINGKLVLTEPGHILYEQAGKILRSLDEAKRRVSDFDNTNGGSVSIGILPTLAPFLLPSALAALSEKFPNAFVIVREDISESLIAAAKRGELDILIEALPFDENNLSVERLFLDPFYLAVHSGHYLAEMEEIHVDVLEGMSFILLEDMHCLTRQIEQFCFSEQFIPKVAFQASQISTIKLLIESQYGISILPSISREDTLDSKIRYVRLVGGDKMPEREIVLATARDRYYSPAAEFFIKTIKKQYKK
ncbi:LysR family transcriptional regulator [Nitrosomonas sp.]|uniref:LysR family transcriptional regulator n=1 Tax=Nitrosomonas sp. TaxID=42353 RepID=UPI00208551C6|nr:LysR family transcriptional regulator [Nitrosomonas sp.]GJL75229.1 MAG: hyaluronan synthase [Nitrosomonas sp.]